MSAEQFFAILLIELRQNKNLQHYYKFLDGDRSFAFRKAYFCQRLSYIIDHIGDKEQGIWDCGCGFGTTALFLSMNGYSVYGTTLEFYFQQLEGRKAFWNAYGDASRFSFTYEALSESAYTERFDTIIVQDTLHHLEPIETSLQLLQQSLKPRGRLLVVEENGRNPLQQIKLLKQRGFKKVIEINDERLGRKILLGNENIRSLKSWQRLLGNAGLSVDAQTLQYVRMFPPALFNEVNYEKRIEQEQGFARKAAILSDTLFFGINFIAKRVSG